MEDAQIIDHFFRRDPEAITAVQEKYEKRCLAAARHILPDARDAEECVSDVWLRLWNAIPPERPRSLAAYITTVTRRLALDKCVKTTASRCSAPPHRTTTKMSSTTMSCRKSGRSH